jgi:tetratricopeptide (TPR) repeat protein
MAVEARRNVETEALVTEVTYLAGTNDAESYAEAYFKKSPGIQNLWLFLQSPRLRYADFLMRRGEKIGAMKLVDQAQREAEQALKEGNQLARVPLEFAAIFAMRGDAEQAIQWLNRAYDAGLRDYRTLRLNPIFADVRQTPRFKALLDRMTADVAEMRQRANIQQTLPRVRPAA